MNKDNRIEHKKISDFQQDASNANKGTERGLRVLDDSLADTGIGRSVVADKNGILIAGNKTQEQSIDRGFEDALVVHTTGDTLVVVQRDDLDLLDPAPNNKARRLAYYDNRAGELGLDWDSEQLLADIQAGTDFSNLFRQDELDELLDNLDNVQFKEYDESIADSVEYCTCPECGHKFPK